MSVRIRLGLLKALTILAAPLLLSMGGAAIWAAPVTAPLLTYAITRDELAFGWRVAGWLVLSLTLAECAWAVAYFMVGGSHPAIVIAPVAVLLISATAGAFLLFRRVARHR